MFGLVGFFVDFDVGVGVGVYGGIGGDVDLGVFVVFVDFDVWGCVGFCGIWCGC